MSFNKIFALLVHSSILSLFACQNDNLVTKVVEKDNTIAEGDADGECDDGEDNDNDAYIDCDDQDCLDDPICQGSPPIVESAALTPEDPRTNDIVVANFLPSDPDGDTVSLSIQWFVDEVEIVGENTPFLDGTSHFEKGQSIKAVATPSDGVLTGASATTNTVVVLNTPPSIPEVLVTPNPAEAGISNLTCTIVQESEDDDQDNIVYTYDWIDASGEIQRHVPHVVSLTDILPPEMVTPGPWTCTVTPYDGEDHGEPDSDTTLVNGACNALSFANVSYVDIGVEPSLFQPGPEFTVELWAKWSGLGGFSQVLISSIASNGSGGWHIALEDGNWRAHIRVDGTDLAIGHPLPQSKASHGQWTHLAMTVSQGPAHTELDFFINGRPVDSASTQTPMTSNGSERLVIGNQQDHLTGARQYTGEISGIRLSNGRRYSALFQPPLQLGMDTDTIASWSFSEGSGQTLGEISGAYDAAISGATWTESCPTEDIDQDGLLAWEDCNDLNADIGKETPFTEPTTGDLFVACEAETDWQTAEDSCVSKGLHLTHIESEPINTWLGQEMTNHFLNPSAGWWIGFNDLASNTLFNWVNGEPFNYTNWAAGNPNHFPDEDCGLMYDNNGGLYAWHDAVCNLDAAFVCR